jgi:hypothetical protein
VARDGDWYVARCLEIEMASQGDTVDEALTNLREARWSCTSRTTRCPATFEHPLVTSIEIRVPA